MRKIHVSVNDVSFYVSAHAIIRGVGQSNEINRLVQQGYAELVKVNATKGDSSVNYQDMDGRNVQVEFT